MILGKIFCIDKKQLIPQFHAGQAEHIDPDGDERADQHVQHPMEGMIQRILNFRIGNHDTDEYNGRQAGGVRLMDGHRAVQGNQRSQTHQRIQRDSPDRKHRYNQQEQ